MYSVCIYIAKSCWLLWLACSECSVHVSDGFPIFFWIGVGRCGEFYPSLFWIFWIFSLCKAPYVAVVFISFSVILLHVSFGYHFIGHQMSCQICLPCINKRTRISLRLVVYQLFWRSNCPNIKLGLVLRTLITAVLRSWLFDSISLASLGHYRTTQETCAVKFAVFTDAHLHTCRPIDTDWTTTKLD